ncbi:MAG TPA: type II toxin-antitoxin system PemK/MazF family toxin [Sedimentisphaerales bacterium]|nr:type II toxin-antitoxin system PemK/MazF family toxin [Sedimentisphaerales bacterium]
MKRGELYRVAHPSARDPKKYRVFVVVSRQVLIDSRFSSVICAPVYTSHEGLATQVPVGPDEGLKHDSSIHCDELVSLPKSMLTSYIGALPPATMETLTQALRVALEIPD